MLGICVGTMAMVIVLSVFNGLEDLNRKLFKASDPDLKIELRDGKFIQKIALPLQEIKKLEGVRYLTEVIEENALARKGDAQMVVTLKGVDSTFEKNSELKNSVVEGDLLLRNKNEKYAFVGAGVFTILGLNIQDFLYPLELWFPRNQKLDVLNPEGNINRTSTVVSGVFSLEQQYDNFIFLPIELVEELTENEGKRTAIEVYADKNTDSVKEKIQKLVGNAYTVKNRDEQNEALFRAIKIEKLFIFISLLFIVGIASFNIFFSLTMLVIDKKDDIETLSAMGATKSFVRQLFMSEGGIIAFIGTASGLLLGVLICWLQIQFGFVKMGMESAIVDAYPVKIQLADLAQILVGVVFITVLASVFPAKRAVAFMK